MEWWAHLTPGQGQLLSGLLTGLGAVLGVILAGTIFAGRVRTLKDALNAAQEALDEHSSTVSEKLAGLEKRLGDVDAQAASLLSGVGRIGGLVENREETSDPDQASEDEEEDAEWANWYAVQEIWSAARDLVEDIVARESIDGRTRAKYGRVDRRQYQYLIELAAEDGNMLGVHKQLMDLWALWLSYRNARNIPSDDEVARGNKLLDEVRTALSESKLGEIRAFSDANPKLSKAEIANALGINQGRVSEALQS